jgi:predicted DNA binding CopG/RHH family protein
MPRKSSAVPKKPAFKNETEEADWLSSPVGRRYVLRSFRAAMRKGVIQSGVRTPSAALDAVRKAGPGRAVQFKNLKAKPTDPAILHKLAEEARASITQAVSLRIPVADLDAAKAIAEKKGVGYQAVLKQAIRDGLRRA